ncbi:MAG: hypothetical protein RR618_04670 [Cellulosilyticaceae bacterium]
MEILGLHDLIVNELFDKHSLSALVYAINAGRELEFIYNGIEYFLSKSGSKKVVSIWTGEVEQSFESMESLIFNATLDGEKFIKVWDNLKLICLF